MLEISTIVKRQGFQPCEERWVLTSISNECSRGDCADCKQVYWLLDHGDRPVFCAHDCHQERKERSARQRNGEVGFLLFMRQQISPEDASQVVGLFSIRPSVSASMHGVQQPNGNESLNEIVCESL